MSVGRVVVVGGGAAGVAVLRGLRRRSYAGEIVVVDQGPGPCDRPPLSKQVLSGAWDTARASLLSPQQLEELRASWLSTRRADWVDVERRVVGLDEGEELSYDDLVIATGVHPRMLRVSTSSQVLRTLEDAQRLKQVLTPGRRLLVIGCGFLGLEVAATATALGAEVRVVDPLERPLADRLGDAVTDRLFALHRERGVEISTGVAVVPRPADAGAAVDGVVRLSNGEAIKGDIVLEAIGCTPTVAWLQGSGLEISDGVVCDEYCSAAPGVWAAGDVARWFDPRSGEHVRIEHQMNAVEQGQTVAKNIMGDRKQYVPVPFFWTDHYEVKVQMCGTFSPDAEPVVRHGTTDGDSFVVTYAEGGRPVAAVGWNAAREMPALRGEILLSPAGDLR